MILTADAQSTVALIAAELALVGVLITSAVSFLESRRSTYLNTVTAERSKWIDKLRVNISHLIAQAHAMHVALYRDDDFSGSDEYDAAVREIMATLTLVRLQLNPDGKIDSNILALLGAIRSVVGEEDYQEVERIFVRHVQWLLKEEWEKVKYEARSCIGRLWAHYRRRRREAAYATFCAGDGSVNAWASPPH